MKTGETFYMDPIELLRPLVGKLVDATINGETQRCRVMSVDEVHGAKLAVVPNTTKE